jgi:apolipoprotein D and lipocalin family protein
VAENRRRGLLYRGAHASRAESVVFRPFYGGYNVIALDKDYRYALVCGPDRDYLWLLARAPKIPPEVKQQMLDIATRQGFDVSKLLWVNQQY